MLTAVDGIDAEQFENAGRMPANQGPGVKAVQGRGCGSAVEQFFQLIKIGGFVGQVVLQGLGAGLEKVQQGWKLLHLFDDPAF